MSETTIDGYRSHSAYRFIFDIIRGLIMRCLACNTELTDLESTRKDATTGEFMDLCGGCLSAMRLAQFEDDIDINSVVTVVTNDEM